MKRFFEKYETIICILLIVLYILTNSYCLQNFGVEDYRSTIINTIFSLALLALIISLNKTKYYGLTKVKDMKKYLYFIPLLLIVSVNVWNGININNTYSEIIFHILTMFNIGFIEEIIFRGFLFKMMAKDNVNTAIIVSSLTFGIGHIINLFNGAHMNLFTNVLQIMYATSTGFMFVIMYEKTKSLFPCIITHSLFNAFSLCMNETVVTPSMQIIDSLFIIVLTLGYAFYIMRRKLYEK